MKSKLLLTTINLIFFYLFLSSVELLGETPDYSLQIKAAKEKGRLLLGCKPHYRSAGGVQHNHSNDWVTTNLEEYHPSSTESGFHIKADLIKDEATLNSMSNNLTESLSMIYSEDACSLDSAIANSEVEGVRLVKSYYNMLKNDGLFITNICPSGRGVDDGLKNISKQESIKFKEITLDEKLTILRKNLNLLTPKSNVLKFLFKKYKDKQIISMFNIYKNGSIDSDEAKKLCKTKNDFLVLHILKKLFEGTKLGEKQEKIYRALNELDDFKIFKKY